MRMVSLHFRRLCLNKLEKDQAWLEEDRAQPEAGYPTEYVRDVRLTHAGVKVSLDVFQTCSSKILNPYYIPSACLRVNFFTPTKLFLNLRLCSGTRIVQRQTF